jgi:hypothetical protein
MSTFPPPAPGVKPVQVTARWISNNLHKPGGQSVVEINGTSYWLTVLRDRGQITGYRLEKFGTHGRVSYDLAAVAGPWCCECGDFLHRRAGQADPALRECKHIAAVRRLLADAGQ